MKTRDLVKKLKSAGYTKERSGDHITYEKEGGRPVQVPHGREVNEYTAQAILKDAGIK